MDALSGKRQRWASHTKFTQAMRFRLPATIRPSPPSAIPKPVQRARAKPAGADADQPTVPEVQARPPFPFHAPDQNQPTRPKPRSPASRPFSSTRSNPPASRRRLFTRPLPRSTNHSPFPVSLSNPAARRQNESTPTNHHHAHDHNQTTRPNQAAARVRQPTAHDHHSFTRSKHQHMYDCRYVARVLQ